ncbi:MAG: tetratricopeptide repeat protein, partial [Candidatus Woesebacteria bacterium]|nr:tetratricopeptide repeat protein [Candidatus Woesebacteria bacterium]
MDGIFILKYSSIYMDTSASQTAISLALSGKWSEAVKINLEIISDNSEDIDAINRLARAYSELGKPSEAREATKKVLKIDPINPIALKCIEKWKSAECHRSHFSGPASTETFLEESGKTKLVTLLNLGDDKIFANLDPGEEVRLFSHAHKVSINTIDGKYIGRLPDDLAARLRNLIKAGNKYQVLMKSVDPKEVKVFIRELEKGEKAPDMPSFPTEKIDYVSFT